MRVRLRAYALLAGAVEPLLVTGCSSPQRNPGASFDGAVRGIVEADTLKDARVSLRRGGWQAGRAPPAPSPVAVDCPAPVEVWPIEHLYRWSPALRAELVVLSVPWLSPADVRKVRDEVWRRRAGADLVEVSHRSGQVQLGAGSYDEDEWQLTMLGEAWTADLLVRAMPEGTGSLLIGACAPASRWDAVRPALVEIAESLEPVERRGIDIATERARELPGAARTWRWILPERETRERVSSSRAAALAALDACRELEADARALDAKANLVALDPRGVVGGKGYDAREVVRLLRQASALDARIGRWWLLGRALLDAGEPDRALEVLEAATGGQPRPAPRALAALGEAQYALGRRTEAQATWRRAQALLAQDLRVFHDPHGSFAADFREQVAALDDLLRR